MRVPDNLAPNENPQIDQTRFFLFLLEVSLSAIEYLFPRIPLFPWLKPGLANIVTIIWIARYGFRDAMLFAIMRIWITAFYFGFSFVTAGLAMSGAVFSCTAMSLVWMIAGKRRLIGSVGISIVGALFHNFGQVLAAYSLLAGNVVLFRQYPLMIMASLIFGTVVGIIAPHLNRFTESIDKHDGTVTEITLPAKPGKIKASISLIIFAGCTSIAFVDKWEFILTFATAVTIASSIIERNATKVLMFPLKKFWSMFLIVAAVPLFFSFGTKLCGFLPFTKEGSHAALIQILRLWAWLECVFIFAHTGFNNLLYRILARLLPNRKQTLYSALLAAEHFPAVASAMHRNWRPLLSTLIKNPAAGLEKLRSDINAIVESE